MKLKERIEDVREMIDIVGENLDDANVELHEMDKKTMEKIVTTDSKGNEKVIIVNPYLEMVKVVDSLTKDYNDLVRMYNELVRTYNDLNKQPEEPKIYEVIDITKMILGIATISASLVQGWTFYKWQRDGYLIGREAQRVQFPRPI